jgi:hypothetical protein
MRARVRRTMHRRSVETRTAGRYENDPPLARSCADPAEPQARDPRPTGIGRTGWLEAALNQKAGNVANETGPFRGPRELAPKGTQAAWTLAACRPLSP